MKSAIIYKDFAYKDTEKKINDFVNNNEKKIGHLIKDANSETFGLLCDFIFSLLDLDKTDNGEISPKYFVLSKFCCSGIINYLEWQTTNKSKTNSKMMNSYFYDILNTLYKWNAEND